MGSNEAIILLDTSVLIDLIERRRFIPEPLRDPELGLKRIRRRVVARLVSAQCLTQQCFVLRDTIDGEAPRVIERRFLESNLQVSPSEVNKILSEVLRLYRINIFDKITDEDDNTMVRIIEKVWAYLTEKGDPCSNEVLDDDDAVDRIYHEFFDIRILTTALVRSWRLITTDCWLACCLPIIIGDAVPRLLRTYGIINVYEVEVRWNAGDGLCHASIYLITGRVAGNPTTGEQCCRACCGSPSHV